ncbi:hypothetical protein ACFW2K_35060 [Streptomyces nigra]|uniref:hypothetical protein n=1 Tax=Streptomyces nigra TaxID=1827580 RepID=UPI0036B1E9E5
MKGGSVFGVEDDMRALATGEPAYRLHERAAGAHQDVVGARRAGDRRDRTVPSACWADVGRHSPAAQEGTAQTIRQLKECVRIGIQATQAADELAPPSTRSGPPPWVTAFQGGLSILISTGSTGSTDHPEAGLDFRLDRGLLPSRS